MMQEQQEIKPAPTVPPRRGTLSFVVIFMACVLLLLTGYRYTIGTVLNDWYLFQVARHTTFVLDLVGHRARLEDEGARQDSVKVRAQLAAWEQGLNTATPDMIAAASAGPLSRWERYQHRLTNSRRNEFKGAIGPRVSFVLRPGLLARLRELEDERARLAQADPNDPALAEIARKLDTLRAEQEALPEGPEGRAQLAGKSFTFIIVPECGAIEVMAIFFAAVVAFPAAMSRRFIGLLLGLPLMYLTNVFRLSCLAVIGAFSGSGEWFDFAHNYVWQAIYIIFVVAVWLAWVEYIVRRRSLWRNRAAAAA